MKLPSKQTRESIKTVVITAFVSGALAFVAGMHVQSERQAEIDAAVHNAVSNQSTSKAAPKQ